MAKGNYQSRAALKVNTFVNSESENKKESIVAAKEETPIPQPIETHSPEIKSEIESVSDEKPELIEEDKSEKKEIKKGITKKNETRKQNGKVGRPSQGEVKKISLAIPIELYSGIESASIMYKGNKTAYINDLIKKDLEANKKQYDALNKLLKK